MWFTWKKMRFCDCHIPFAVWIAFSSILSNARILTNAQEESSEMVHPSQEHDLSNLDSILTSSSSSRNVLKFPFRNFTRVATIQYNNNNNNNNTKLSNLNHSLQNLKRPSFFTLNLQSKKSSAESSTDSPLFLQATTDLINASLSQINESVNETLKTISILDRLRNLTNLKLKIRGSGTQFGVKSFGKQKDPLEDAKDLMGKNSSQIKYGNEKLKALLAAKTIKTESLESPKNDTEIRSEIIDETPMSIIAGHINMNQNSSLITSSTSPVPKPMPLPHSSTYNPVAPVVLKVGKFAKNSLYSNNSNSSENLSTSSSTNTNEAENIERGETRVAITADQLSGNRPTKMPFHFTSAAPTPPSTSTYRDVAPQRNRYQKLHSPHNHAYSPTQDPVSIAHNEDLSVEDFQDFRVANLVFGSKVGAEISTLSPNPPTSLHRPPSTSRNRPRPSYEDEDDDEDHEDNDGALPVRTLQQNTHGRPSVQIATPEPTTRATTRPPQKLSKFVPKNPRKSPLPQSASSGVKNAHVSLVSDNNLPFYKEPGGVFKEHKYTHGDQDDESNQISHNSYSGRSPGVKYAPLKGPTAQPQTHYPNRGQPNLYSHPHANQQPVLQQPVYMQPVQHHVHQPQQGLYPGFSPPYTSQQPHLQQQHPTQAQNLYLPQQRPTQPQNLYYQPQPVAVAPTPYYPVAPQPQLFATHVTGFVPLQQHQLHQTQQPYHAPQPIAAPPVQPQPVYHGRNQQQQPRRQNGHGYNDQNDNHFNNYAPREEQRDEKGNFPSRSDPDSDSFYGDPRPDTRNEKKYERKPVAPKPRKPQGSNQGKKQQQGKNTGNSQRKDEQPEEEEEEEPHEDEEPEEDRRASRPSPPPPPPRRPPAPLRDNRPEEDSNHSQERGRGGRNRDNDYDEVEEPSPNRNDIDDERDNNRRKNNHNNNRNNNNNNDRRPQYNRNNDDYDADFFEPNNNNPRPVFNEIPNGPHGDFVDLGNNFGNPTGRRQPFKPSPVDSGPVRPSNPDYRPSFDHPNIQYPNNQNNNRGGSSNNLRPISHNNGRGPDYDPRGFGVGFGPSPGNVQLDPIYTRTIKQYDQELVKPNNNNNRRPPEREEASRGDRRGHGNRNRDEDLRDEVDDRPIQGHNRGRDEEEEERPRKIKVQQEDDEDEERPSRGQEAEGENERPPARGQDEEQDDEERPRNGQEVDEEDRPRRGQGQDTDEEERPRRGQGQEVDEEEGPQRGQGQDVEEEEEDEERSAKRDEPEEKKEEAKEEETEDEEPEEEEEEEEEAPKKPLGNRQRKGSKDGQGKKPPPKKPIPKEKSGDLEEDIRGIEREFGGFG